MAERDALLAAVCANPDEDTPRLVFADWLQENGEEYRAEFIRLQIELAQLPTSDRAAKLKYREETLLDGYGDHWLDRVRPFTAPGWGERWWEFCRGFVERMSVNGDDGGGFFAAEESLRQFPLQTLWFPYLQDYEPIARWSGLRWITELMLQGSVLAADMGIGALFRSPHAAGLRVLRLNGYDDNGHLDLDAVRELAVSDALLGLKHLDLRGNWSTWQHGPSSDWVRVLAGAAFLPQLERLDLGGTSLCGEGVEIIARSPQVANLQHLDLSANKIGGRGVRALVESPYLGQLQTLDLQDIGEVRYQRDPVTPGTRAKLVERFGTRVRL